MSFTNNPKSYNEEIAKLFGELVYPNEIAFTTNVKDYIEKTKSGKKTHFKFETQHGRVSISDVGGFQAYDRNMAMRGYLHEITAMGAILGISIKEKAKLEKKLRFHLITTMDECLRDRPIIINTTTQFVREQTNCFTKIKPDTAILGYKYELPTNAKSSNIETHFERLADKAQIDKV